MSLNLATGQWEDDEHPDGGSIGEQIGAPVSPMPPPPTQAPGPEAPSPAPAPTVPGAHGPDDVLPPSPGTEPAPPPALPSVAPAPLNFPAPVPAGGVVSPAESANLAAIDKTTAGKAQTATQQGQLNAAGARARSDAADRDLAEQQRFIDEQKRILDESQKKTAERTAQANADWNAYKETGIKDPEADKSFGRRFLEAIMVGLGAYNSAINKGPNTALDIIQQATKDNIDAQKAKIEKLYQTAQRSGKNVEEATKERDDALAQLNLKHSAQLATGADMLRQQLSKIGIPQAQIDANVDIQKLDGEALQKREDTLKGIREDETKLAQANIAAAARKAKAGAGSGGNKPVSELVQMKLDGADDATIAKRAEELHMKPKDYLPSLANVRADAKAGGGGAVDQKLLVRDVDGTPAGLASTARAVPALQSDLRTNAQALQQLMKLREKHQLTATGPEFHDAVLALASVTTAGKTDTTTAHEKGAITNFLGMPSEEGIDNKIDQIKTRIQQIKAQLNPLPDNYGTSPEQAGAAKGLLERRKGPAAEKAPKVPASVIEDAKAEVRRNGPHAASAKKLLDQQGITVL